MIPRMKAALSSDSEPGKFYTVELNGDAWTCTCDAFNIRRADQPDYICKHIIRAQEGKKKMLQQQAKDTAPPKLKKAIKKHGTLDKPRVTGDTYDFGKDMVYGRVTSVLSECKNPQGLIKWGARMGATAMKENEDLSIEEAELAPFFYREKKAKIGTNVHDFIEIFNSEEPDKLISDLKPAERGYAYAFLSWIESLGGRDKVQTIAQEVPVYSKEHGYAGRMDWLVGIGDKVWLVDFKTSKWVDDDYGLQLAAYKHALLEMKQIENIDGMAVLHLRPDETFKFVEFDEPLEVFLAMKKVWQWRDDKKKLA